MVDEPTEADAAAPKPSASERIDKVLETVLPSWTARKEFVDALVQLIKEGP